MRKLIVVVMSLALVVGVTYAVWAETAGGMTPLKCTDTAWRTTPVSTSSTQWAKVPGLERRPIAIFPIAINVSALVSGAPVEFRVLSTNIGGQTTVSKPGPTRFVPGSDGANSFAYQWIERNPVGAPHKAFVRLQWRSPSAAAVQMRRGDISMLYASDSCQGSS